MDFKKFKELCPIHEIPEKLVNYLTSKDEEKVEIGNFYILKDPDKELEGYFRYHKDYIKIFDKIFGLFKDDIGNFYGYWIYEGCNPCEAPIIVIIHDGDSDEIVANNLKEFLSLIMIGSCPPISERSILEQTFCTSEDYENDFWIDNWKYDVENFLDDDFLTELDITPPINPFELMRKARNAHPDVNEWFLRYMFNSTFKNHELPILLKDLDLFKTGIKYYIDDENDDTGLKRCDISCFKKFTNHFFTTEHGLDIAEHFCKKDKKLANNLFIFCESRSSESVLDKTGYYGILQVDEFTLNDSPIVCIPINPSEYSNKQEKKVEKASIICGNLREFYSLIAVGFDLLEPRCFYEQKPKITEDVIEFRRIVKETFGIDPAQNPSQLYEGAKTVFASFLRQI